MTDQYAAFLEKKALVHISTGLTGKIDIHSRLFPFQGDLTTWALRKGRAALFEATGLGKSIQQLEWARHVEAHTERPVLILAPLSVAHQTRGEAIKHLGIEPQVVATDSEVKDRGIFITNYQKLHKFDVSRFGGVVLDECFAPNTEVDVIENGIYLKKEIRHIRAHESIPNVFGVDTVKSVHRRPIKRAVKVTFGGQSIIASENHPFLTDHGWIAAKNLSRETMRLVETSEAVRLVWRGVQPEISGSQRERGEILREILLSEMANASTGDCGESSQPGSGCEAGKISPEMAKVGTPEGISGNREGQSAQSDVKSIGSIQGEPDIKGHEPETFRSWWKRGRDDQVAISALGGATEWMGERVCLVTGKTNSRLSDLLQNGLGESAIENLNRSGWELPSSYSQTREGSEERFEAGRVWMDDVEILESGHPELEQFRDADGNIYFYDIGATRHPSYTINGCLVHNSSILKSLDGATAAALIEGFSKTPFRLVCTATPSPNDVTEIGSYAQFLGVMTMSEMLSTFFIHDGGETQKWRLKGHAEKEFWKWMASWAACIAKPSDLGYSNEGYDLPKLHMHEHIVEGGMIAEGELFTFEARTLNERRGARRDSMDARTKRAAELINGDPDQWVIWCGLNAEGDALRRAIHGAVEVSGADSDEFKESVIRDFLSGKIRRIISKCVIFGYGLNIQCCKKTLFFGVSDSYEQFHQAIRRFWRYGQKEEVHAHIIISDSEGAVLKNIKKKELQAVAMQENLVSHMADLTKKELHGTTRNVLVYNPQIPMQLPMWI